MHQDKLNKILQEKLNNLKELPQGVSFNPSSTWNKIENNLIGRKKQKTIWWYYAAASILLIVSTIAFYNSGSVNINTEMAVVKTSTPSSKIIISNQLPVASGTSTQSAAIVKHSPGQKEILKQYALTPPTPEKSAIKKQTQVLEIPAQEPEVKEDAILPTMADLAANEPAPFLQIKKSDTQVNRKFKVVHINDENIEVAYKNVALEKTKSKPSFFNFTLRSQNLTQETSTLNSSPKNQGGLFKAELN